MDSQVGRTGFVLHSPVVMVEAVAPSHRAMQALP
jgi:hypothetical protein